MLAILAPQWQGGNTSPCHCEARIASFGVPAVIFTPNPLKYVNYTTRWCNFHRRDTSCPTQGTTLSPAPTRLPPPSQDPSQRALYLRSRRRGVYRASASARSHRKNLLFFASSRACRYPTVTAPSRRGSSTRFDGDIGYVIIDVSLLRHRVASSG